nr:hypothetical protein [Tanacetum cinerariifolium]
VASPPADQDSTNTTENFPYRKLWLSMAAVVSRIDTIWTRISQRQGSKSHRMRWLVTIQQIVK